MTPNLPDRLDEALRHVESCYPAEGCGVLLHGPEGWKVLPMQNVYDRYHAIDPSRFPRSSKTAYLFDPKAWLDLNDQADRAGQRVACIFHSHADVGAYFSAEDRAMAAPDGVPLLPDVSYLVVAVDKGRATGAKLFWWDGKDYAERLVPL